ncbi:MAG: lipopolysaccharide biosynthesis protein [Candidatus Limnocylindria bacterium]
MRSQILRLGRNTAIYGIGQVLLRMVSLLLLPLYTSYLTPADYGISSILGVMTYFLTPIFALGISGALGIVYFGREEPRDRAATIWTAFTTLAASAALLAIGGWAVSDRLAVLLFPTGQSTYDLSYLVTVALLTAATSIATQPLLARLQFEERAKTFVAITLSSSALSIALSVVLIVGLGRGVAGFIESAAIAQALTLVVAMVVSLRGLFFQVRPTIARELLVVGIPLIPGFLAIFVMLQANKALLQAGAGLDELGIYTVGFNIGLLMTLLVSGFTSAWFPFFSSFMHQQDRAGALFARVMTYYVLGAGTVSLLFFIGAQPLIRLATQPPFWGAYVSVGPSAAAQFLIGVHSVLVAGMYFTQKVRAGVVIQGAAATVSVVLNLLLIPPLGAAGAAIAVVLGFVTMVVLQHGWNVARVGFHVPYEWRRLAAFAAIYVTTAVFFLWNRSWPLAAELGLSVLATVLVVGLVLAIVSPAERAQARAEIARRLGRGTTAGAGSAT